MKVPGRVVSSSCYSVILARLLNNGVLLCKSHMKTLEKGYRDSFDEASLKIEADDYKIAINNYPNWQNVMQ